MSKLLALDYGKKRCGLAETDDMQIIASGLAGIYTEDLYKFLQDYFKQNKVEKFIIGLPINLKGEIEDLEKDIRICIHKLNELFPQIPIERVDERFTSKMAAHAISLSGKNKKKRESKHLLDETSAVIILQTYLNKKKII